MAKYDRTVVHLDVRETRLHSGTVDGEDIAQMLGITLEQMCEMSEDDFASALSQEAFQFVDYDILELYDWNYEIEGIMYVGTPPPTLAEALNEIGKSYVGVSEASAYLGRFESDDNALLLEVKYSEGKHAVIKLSQDLHVHPEEGFMFILNNGAGTGVAEALEAVGLVRKTGTILIRDDREFILVELGSTLRKPAA